MWCLEGGNCRGNPCSMRHGTDRICRVPWDEKPQHSPTSCFPSQGRGSSSFSQLLNQHFEPAQMLLLHPKCCAVPPASQELVHEQGDTEDSRGDQRHPLVTNVRM